MAIFDIGMTQEQVMEASKPAPANRYKMVFKGFLPNEEAEEGAKIFWPTKSGAKQVKAMFTILSPDPVQNGKGIIYSCTIGSAFFSRLCGVLPLMSGTGIDEEAALGMEIEADVVVNTYTRRDGEPGERNDITKMYMAA